MNKNLNQQSYLKYLKYKKKYLNLKLKYKYKLQKGGHKFHVIPNSGRVTEYLDNETKFEMSNQCIWISLRDYFQNFLELQSSVLELKNIAKIDIYNTQNTQFDWETPNFRRGIEIIAQIYNLRIEFFLVDHNNNHHPSLIYDDGTPMPMHIINDHGHNIVKIAFYGAHFQLIIPDNGINTPQEFIQPAQFHIFDNKTRSYSPPKSEQSEKEISIMKLYVKIIDLQQQKELNIKKIDDINKTSAMFLKLVTDMEKHIRDEIASNKYLSSLPSNKDIKFESHIQDLKQKQFEHQQLKLHIDNIPKENTKLEFDNISLADQIKLLTEEIDRIDK